ncbi:hypothetical protein Tco_1087886, partial [Tanacetum coccineum]
MSNTNTNLQTQTSNALHNAIMETGGKDRPPMLALVITFSGNIESRDTSTLNLIMNTSTIVSKIHLTNSNGLRRLFQLQKEVQKPLQKGIDNDIYSIVYACPNSCDLWKAIKRLKQGELINVQDLETNLYWEFGKFTSRDGEALELVVNVARARENAKDAAYHKEKMLLCKQEEAGFQLNAEEADWRDDTDVEPEDQELEAHYLYMAQIQEVQNNDDNYNVFANDQEHPVQPEFVNDTYLEEQGDTTIDSLDMSTNGETINQDDDDLAKERDLLASLIEKLKYKIDDNKNRNKFLELSNKTLIDNIEDFKTKNKSLESSNNHFKEENNELSKTNQLMFKDLKKFQAELD